MKSGGFKEIRWGKDDAKGDDDLIKYFVPIPGFDQIYEGTKRFVVGRKGAGKTAVIERVRLAAETDSMQFVADLTLRDFPIHDLKEMADKSQRDKSKYVPIWLFLIYAEIARTILQDNGAHPTEQIEELRDFLRLNHLLHHSGFAHTLTELKKSNSKVKVNASWVEAERGSGNGSEAVVEIHYNKIVKALAERIRNIQSESTYWMFMDELDEGFRAGDQAIRLLLLALIRAVEDSAIELRNSAYAYRPLLVLRSDIFDRLEDNDLNKIDDYVIRLRWNSAKDHVEHSLKRVVIQRIESSIGTKAWDDVADDYDGDIPAGVENLWQYIANRTYERPRDVIKFMKYCGQHSVAGQKLSFKQVKAAEDDYSAWLYRELKDELHSYLPCWKEALDCITRIGTGKFSKAQLESELEADSKVKQWVSSSGKTYGDVIETLFDFGVVGNLDQTKRWLFKYKDEDLTWNPKMDVIVHFGLNRKLKLLKRPVRGG